MFHFDKPVTVTLAATVTTEGLPPLTQQYQFTFNPEELTIEALTTLVADGRDVFGVLIPHALTALSGQVAALLADKV